MRGSFLLRTNHITTALAAILIACGLFGPSGLWSGQSRSVAEQLKLPDDVANYKEWRALLQSPEPVPLELWLRCTTSTPADWAQAREKHGPHADHYIQVYANQIATQTMLQGKPGLFPTGAVIAKEKLTDSPQGTVAGVAFMIKRGTPQFSKNGGWEFAYYPRSGDPASIQACATCHRSAESKDYVFGQYPSSGDSLQPH
jgi:hypothetical protein